MSRRRGTRRRFCEAGPVPRPGGARTPAPAPALVASVTALAVLATPGCATRSPDRTPEPVSAAQGEPMDPVGVYDLTMSSETMVSEGTMEINGEPGAYLGRVSVGGVSGRIVLVEPGEGHMIVQVVVEAGRLVLRLAGDGAFLSGNWLMGERRGAVVAERRPGSAVRRPRVHRQVAASAPLRPRPVVDRDIAVSGARHPPGKGAGAGS